MYRNVILKQSLAYAMIYNLLFMTIIRCFQIFPIPRSVAAICNFEKLSETLKNRASSRNAVYSNGYIYPEHTVKPGREL